MDIHRLSDRLPHNPGILPIAGLEHRDLPLATLDQAIQVGDLLTRVRPMLLELDARALFLIESIAEPDPGGSAQQHPDLCAC